MQSREKNSSWTAGHPKMGAINCTATSEINYQFTSSSVGATARCGLWPVEQGPPFFFLSPVLSIFSLPSLEDLFLLFSPSFPTTNLGSVKFHRCGNQKSSSILLSSSTRHINVIKILNFVIFIIPENNILQLFLLLWLSLIQRIVWIVLFSGISHNAYKTGLESGTDKHVSITLF